MRDHHTVSSYFMQNSSLNPVFVPEARKNCFRSFLSLPTLCSCFLCVCEQTKITGAQSSTDKRNHSTGVLASDQSISQIQRVRYLNLISDECLSLDVICLDNLISKIWHPGHAADDIMYKRKVTKNSEKYFQKNVGYRRFGKKMVSTIVHERVVGLKW